MLESERARRQGGGGGGGAGEGELCALDLTPLQVHPRSIDERALADGASALFQPPRCEVAAAAGVGVGVLWRTLFSEMQRSCEDAHPDVRHCAIRTRATMPLS